MSQLDGRFRCVCKLRGRVYIRRHLLQIPSVNPSEETASSRFQPTPCRLTAHEPDRPKNDVRDTPESRSPIRQLSSTTPARSLRRRDSHSHTALRHARCQKWKSCREPFPTTREAAPLALSPQSTRSGARESVSPLAPPRESQTAFFPHPPRN